MCRHTVSMLPFGGNVSEALVVLTATVAARNNQWFSDPSVTSLFDRVFDVVGSDPCYIGACTGPDRIVLTSKQARAALLSGSASDFRSDPSVGWEFYFDYCRPMLVEALPIEAKTLSGLFSDRLIQAGLESTAEVLFKNKTIATNYTLNDLEYIASYMLERQKGRAHLDAMLRGCDTEYDKFFFAVRSAKDATYAFQMRESFVKEDLAALAVAAQSVLGATPAAGSGSGGG